ncbi:YchJ family protein [Kribbella solani]|uniref:YchJ family protein n=1 Tax=Kribbella solani TaxID=236067 RepID=UPI0029B9CF4F|nr:YchJ family metal-binding protein [Kribbella solani]MDX2974401.1 YchJ family metal-binding protein [Kribbella solani]
MAALPTCPCGRGVSYDVCCGRLHLGVVTAATAEELMRSRYSAFVRHDAAYLQKTWSRTTRPTRIDFPNRIWTGLEILGTTGGSVFHTEGTVEFNAHYTTGIQHENSTFTRETGEWVYVAAL